MSAIGSAVLVAALAATVVVAWWFRTRDGVVRTSERREQADMNPVFERLGVRPGDADLTIVQFATAFCAPCRATKARVQQLQVGRPGLAYVHVDAESHLEEVRALDVRRTPTLFFLDRAGAVLGRSSGAPRPDELAALVSAHVVVRPGADAEGC